PRNGLRMRTGGRAAPLRRASRNRPAPTSNFQHPTSRRRLTKYAIAHRHITMPRHATLNRPCRGCGRPPFSANVKEIALNGFEYKVVYVDFRGRISSEGAEYIRQGGEHRTGFVRGYLDKLGEDGWELTGVLPLHRPESSYFVLKRGRTATATASEG